MRGEAKGGKSAWGRSTDSSSSPSPLRSCEANRATADAADGHTQVVAGLDRHHCAERAGQHDLAGLEADARRAEHVLSHATALSGWARVAAPAPVTTIRRSSRAPCRRWTCRARAGRPCGRRARTPAGGVVRHGVLDADLPVADARIDDLEAGHHTLCGAQHIRRVVTPGPSGPT